LSYQNLLNVRVTVSKLFVRGTKLDVHVAEFGV